MTSSPPPAGTDQEELEGVSGEAPLPLHAAETGAGEEIGAPSASEDQADGSDDGEEGDAMEEDEDGGDDTNMELGEEEEEEDSEYSSGYWQEYDEEQLAADLEEFVNLPKDAEEDGERRQDTKPEVATCCVCMEPWTSGGAHRIWYKHFLGSDPYFHSAYKKIRNVLAVAFRVAMCTAGHAWRSGFAAVEAPLPRLIKHLTLSMIYFV
jgi:hypothetical protein